MRVGCLHVANVFEVASLARECEREISLFLLTDYFWDFNSLCIGDHDAHGTRVSGRRSWGAGVTDMLHRPTNLVCGGGRSNGVIDSFDHQCLSAKNIYRFFVPPKGFRHFCGTHPMSVHATMSPHLCILLLPLAAKCFHPQM
jgi:hypothetical protein